MPMALAGSGSYKATRISTHIHTNAEVVQKFLSIEVDVKKLGSGHCEIRLSHSMGAATGNWNLHPEQLLWLTSKFLRCRK